MQFERVCGTCDYGGDAYNRSGYLDENFVICQIKEAENRQRKPDRFQTTSAVSRMHVQREACLYWKPRGDETPLPEFKPAEEVSTEDSIYDMLYGKSEIEYVDPAPIASWQMPQYQAPVHATPATQTTAKASADSDSELKRLKNQVMQQEQMITSLQHQNVYLSEENQQLKDDYQKAKDKLEQLKPFDVALFAEVNYFSLLGIKENASPDQIKEAYRARMKILHPDRFINISQRLNLAYETLSDPVKKQKYLVQIKGKPHA